MSNAVASINKKTIVVSNNAVNVVVVVQRAWRVSCSEAT